MTVVIFLLLVSGVLIQAYRDLSEPGAWDYWNDRYFSPSMTSSVAGVDLGGRRTRHWCCTEKSAPPARAGFASGSMKPSSRRATPS